VIAKSEQERFWWRSGVALVAAIYLSAYFVEFVVEFLFARDLLRLTIGIGFGLVAIAVAVAIARRGATWKSWLLFAVCGAGYAGAALGLEVVQERIHLVEYGVVALVFRSALAARAAADPECGFRSTWAIDAGALGLGFVAGFGDELLQAVLPNRHYDLRDIGLNAVAAAMALLAARMIESTLETER
jgi:hypothetical protein